MQKKTQNKEEKSETHRVAKVIARSGFCSRREAERLIKNGRVKVNEKIITSPALNIKKDSEIFIDDQPITKWERTRLWLYHKPIGLLTTNSDPEGRPTIFDRLPADLPRLMSVGRLDLNSEGLLLLTNKGYIKRYLELPKNKIIRTYLVKTWGRDLNTKNIEEMSEGVVISEFKYAPLEIDIVLKNKNNNWYNIKLIEGKNREIRKILGHFGLKVKKLIRIGYGEFFLKNQKVREVLEVPIPKSLLYNAKKD